MIRQCAILFGCLALGELIVFLTGIKLHPFLKIGLDKTALGAGNVRLLGC